MQNELKRLLAPRSVAVIGASREAHKVGHIIVKNILEGGYTGTLFVLNPHEFKILGVPCYKDFHSLPETPDLAIVAVPAAIAVSVLPEIAERGTKNVVIVSAGFKEAGEKGAQLEEALLKTARRYNLTILGPNCLGFFNASAQLNATFGRVATPPGNVRLISQSGATVTAFFDWAEMTELGVQACVTTGNKTILSENDILAHWLANPLKLKRDRELADHSPIGLYLESVAEGETLLELLTATSRVHPVCVLKPGKSQAAKSAMRSHTGSLAGDDAIFDAAMREAGANRCEGLEEFFDYLRLTAWETVPLGPRVAIVSNAGGPATMASDMAEAAGLTVAPLSKKTEARLRQALPPMAAIHDPVDVLGDAPASRYADALATVLKERSVQAVLVLLTPQMMTEIKETALVISKLSRTFGKPIVCAFIGGSLVRAGEQILNQHKIPSFRFPERALKALGAYYRWGKWRREHARPPAKMRVLPTSARLHVEDVLTKARTRGAVVLDPIFGHDLATAANMNVPLATEAHTITDALDFAKSVRFPVVLKFASATVLHKTESKAVITDIGSEAALRRIFEDMERRRSRTPNSRIQIQKQVPSGIEVIVGVKRDPDFGNVLLMGAGGVMAELVKDTQLVPLPASREHIQAALTRTAVFKLLSGFRGGAPYAIGSLLSLIYQLCELAESGNAFQEVEINPVIVTPENAFAVDIKAILRSL